MKVAALHEFIASRRKQILAAAYETMQTSRPRGPQERVNATLARVLDEITAALQRHAGLPAESPLPERSEAAAELGVTVHGAGDPVSQIARDLGAVSHAVGEVAAREGVAFPAREYQEFNHCIDTSIGEALERYWDRASQVHRADTTERIGFLAHELRNALASSRMALAVLREGRVGLNSRTGDILERGMRRMQDLINQTLIAAQLQSGMPARVAPVRVDALLADLASEVVPERGVQVVVDCADGLSAVGDEKLLVSAVGNLLQNALKFTHARSEVALRGVLVGHGADARVAIEVQDACGGLPPGKAEELFSPFVQRGEDRRGLGLGLSISREAMQAQGGRIGVRNLPGTGCVFYVELPRAA